MSEPLTNPDPEARRPFGWRCGRLARGRTGYVVFDEIVFEGRYFRPLALGFWWGFKRARIQKRWVISGEPTMPSKTAKQHRAMEAAKHGKSKLGIPKKAGKEFVKADTKAGKFGHGKKKARKKSRQKCK